MNLALSPKELLVTNTFGMLKVRIYQRIIISWLKVLLSTKTILSLKGIIFLSFIYCYYSKNIIIFNINYNDNYTIMIKIELINLKRLLLLMHDTKIITKFDIHFLKENSYK